MAQPFTQPKSGRKVMVLLGLGLLLVAAIVFFWGNGSWRQELRLHVSTPGGPIEPSQVIEVKFEKGSDWLGEFSRDRLRLKGEALVVELGEKRLFVLLDGETGRWVWRARIDPLPRKERRSMAADLRRFKRQYDPLDLPRELWPRMVTFGDVTDSTSVVAVDPEDLAATFGPGFALERITVAATKDPISPATIRSLLTWLSDYPEPLLCPPSDEGESIPLCRRVKHGDFARTT